MLHVCITLLLNSYVFQLFLLSYCDRKIQEVYLGVKLYESEKIKC
jgi:hypothetical protein